MLAVRGFFGFRCGVKLRVSGFCASGINDWGAGFFLEVLVSALSEILNRRKKEDWSFPDYMGRTSLPWVSFITSARPTYIAAAPVNIPS